MDKNNECGCSTAKVAAMERNVVVTERQQLSLQSYLHRPSVPVLRHRNRQMALIRKSAQMSHFGDWQAAVAEQFFCEIEAPFDQISMWRIAKGLVNAWMKWLTKGRRLPQARPPTICG